ncbi:MAG: hydroxyacid dehydrogenase [Actinocatenispora sp.]
MADRQTAVFALHPHLLPDIFPAALVERLRHSVDIDPTAVLTSLDTAADRNLLSRADILLTGWGCPRLDAAALSHAGRLRAVLHAAGSVKGHTTPALFEAGVTVSSAVHVNARPVAEFTVAAIVFGTKRVFSHAAAYRAGNPTVGYPANEDTGVAGSTVGVIGASRIGRLVLRLLAAYDVRCLVHDPFLDPGEAADLGAEPVGLDELCRRSDVVTVHAPDLPETRGMIDERRLGLMRDGAVLVNTARGTLVDTEALTAHCARGRLDAVLDVTDPEPLPPDHELLRLPNVLVTPHLAGARGRELPAFGEFVVSEVERLVAGDPLAGRVELADLNRIA